MRQLLLNVDREMNELGLICKSTCLSVAKKKKINNAEIRSTPASLII